MGLLDELDRLGGSQNAGRGAKALNVGEGGSSSSSSKIKPSVKGQQSKTGQGHFESWSLSQLQNEVRKYGFRPSQTRQLLLDQLRQVEDALQEQKLQKQQEQSDGVGDSSMASTSSSFLDYSMDVSGDGDSMSDFTMNVIRQAKDHRNSNTLVAGKRTSTISVDDDDEEDVGSVRSNEDCDGDAEDEDLWRALPDHQDVALSEANIATSTSSPTEIAASLSNQLYKAVTMDKPLYHRILLFEPVSFDEVSSTAKRAGVTGLRNKEMLRNWLDMQGICFYSGELTGQRQRY